MAQLTLATHTKVPTPLEHRLRALPYLARNVGLVSSATHVWVWALVTSNHDVYTSARSIYCVHAIIAWIGL